MICHFNLQKAQDFGGPRKEFLTLIMRAIKQKYFDDGIKEHLASDYLTAGTISFSSWPEGEGVPQNFLCLKNLTTCSTIMNSTFDIIKLDDVITFGLCKINYAS